MSSNRFQSFDDFFPYYLAEHASPVCRGFHYVGTGTATLLGVYAFVTMQFWLVPAAMIWGYLWSWIGHLVFEKNRPATFRYPLWSFRGDFKMLMLYVTGRLQPVLDKALDDYPARKTIH